MNKIAMITGASRGLGKEFATQLAAKNYSLILLARCEQRLNALKEDLEQRYAVPVTVVIADLTVSADVDRIISILGSISIDLVVNAAGFGTIGLFAHNCIEKSMRMVRLQVDAITRICYACLPGMLEKNYGDIINVSSTIAYMTQRYNVVYAATKYYLTGFGAALNRELHGKDVHVQTLFPGLTRTEFYDTEELAPARLSVKIPEKFWMQPDAVVKASLKAINYHKKFVVPGIRNKFFILAYQLSDYWQMWVRGSHKTIARYE